MQNTDFLGTQNKKIKGLFRDFNRKPPDIFQNYDFWWILMVWAPRMTWKRNGKIGQKPTFFWVFSREHQQQQQNVISSNFFVVLAGFVLIWPRILTILLWFIKILWRFLRNYVDSLNIHGVFLGICWEFLQIYNIFVGFMGISCSFSKKICCF